jgi:Mn-containing catalase
MDGKGEFEYVANPQPLGPEPQPPQPEAQLHGTPQNRQAQQGNGSSSPPVVQHIG